MPDSTLAVLTPAQIIETALAASVGQECIVVVTTRSTANVRWANNTVTTSGVSAGMSWFVVSIVGGGFATVNASNSDASCAATVIELVRRSEYEAKAAALIGPAEDRADVVGPDQAGGSDAGFTEAGAQTSFGIYRKLLDGLAEVFDQARTDDRLIYGFARHEVVTTYLGTSTGVRRRFVQPTGTLEVNAKSADLARSSWEGISSSDFSDVDVVAISVALARRLDWARRRLELPAGRYDTVLPPTAVADFMVYLAWSAGARSAYEGHSAFARPGGGTRVGEQLTDLGLSVYSDPAMPGQQASPFVVTGASSELSSVFDNGAAIGRTEVISGGQISELVHTRRLAAEHGTRFSPLADNLMMDGGDESSTQDLVAGVRRGLLVTSQWYLREVDPMTMLLTGLTRDGVFLIEHGEIVGAVNNFRFNMSPLDVLRQACAVGRTEAGLSREWSDWFTRSAMPAIVVDGFNMSSVSKAQ